MLTNAEKETIIIFDEAEKLARIETFNGRLIRPSQWNFFRGCFSHIGIEPGRVMVVSQEEYERVAGKRG